MNFKKYFVLEELLKLSQKSDEIISKSLSYSAEIYDNFFEEAKDKIRQILCGNFSHERKKSPLWKRSDGLNSSQPLSEYRAHVHVKNKDQNSAVQEVNFSSPPDVESKESDDGHPLPISTQIGNKVSEEEKDGQNLDSVLESHNINEVVWSRKPSSDVQLDSNRNSTDNLVSNLSNDKVACCQIMSDSQRESSAQITPDVKVQNLEDGKTYIVKKKKFNNFLFSDEENLRNAESTCHNIRMNNRGETSTSGASCNTVKNVSKEEVFDKTYSISSDSSKENINISNEGVFEKTYVISSDTSKENCKTSEENYKTPCNSLTRFFNVEVQDEYRRKGKRKMGSRTNSDFIKENVTKNIIEDDVLLGLNKRKKTETSDVCRNSKVSLEGEQNNVTLGMTYRLRSLEKKCSGVEKTKEALGVVKITHFQERSSPLHVNFKNTYSGCSRNKVLEFGGLQNHQKAIIEVKNHIPILRSGKRKFSDINESARNFWKSGIERKGSRMANIKSYAAKKEKTAQRYRRILSERRMLRDKGVQRRIQTYSSSVDQRKDFGWKPRPSTPAKFTANCNRQSLKDKAEEKRKQREMRVQETKERREHLKKEKEERIRLSEQRLKQRFQQHEEMLKQKIEKFKIKSQNRQRCSTKRNLLSTSSKDSREDRAEDNDNCCRNRADSGQELSKESNGYHDVSLKKVDLASLEGNAGINPIISEKHNAIPVGCEETPVEFAISCDGTGLKKAGNVPPLSRVDSRLEESKESHSESLERHERLQRDTHVDGISSGSKAEFASNDLKFSHSVVKPCVREQKVNLTSSDGTPFKTPKSKTSNRLNFLSNQMLKNVSEKSHNPYFLRSAQKNYQDKNGKSDVFDSPMKDVFQKETKKKISCDAIATPLESKKSKCDNLCSKYSKSQKLRKTLKTPSSQINRCSTRTGETKESTKNSVKETPESFPKSTPKTVHKKKQKVTSYKISGMHDNSFEESKLDPNKIPLWATSLYLKQALICQHYKPPNVEKIFGILAEPVDLVDMFGRNKPEYHKRTSSEHWNLDLMQATTSTRKNI